ncbi:RDD family protein [Corticicoccus populi]|uniref:RDD family protein n=1 Tax=Corticicoccus populi TaxID=1812821 RepID=A0ABW5WUA2_9STAP
MLEFRGLLPRLAARILDIIIIGVPSGFIVGFSFGFTYVTERSDNFIFNIVMLCLTIIYMVAVPLRWKGYTIGKRVCSIHILTMNQSPLNYKVMLKRELFMLIVYPLSFGILAVISMIMMVTREDKRALHDLYAKTAVVSDK